MTEPGTLLFSGVDVATLGRLENAEEFWQTADLRGDLASRSGINGLVAARRPLAGQVRSGQIVVETATPTATHAAVEAAKSALKVNLAQTVTRRRGSFDVTQSAITKTVTERWLGKRGCRLTFAVETLDGPWYAASVAIPAVGAHTIAGDCPTTRITATLSAGAVNPVVTNTTNGYSFRYVGTVPVGGVVVDVAARTAYAGVTNVSSALRWAKSDLLQLDPGAQTLTISSGTASFTYLPAYL